MSSPARTYCCCLCVVLCATADGVWAPLCPEGHTAASSALRQPAFPLARQSVAQPQRRRHPSATPTVLHTTSTFPTHWQAVPDVWSQSSRVPASSARRRRRHLSASRTAATVVMMGLVLLLDAVAAVSVSAGELKALQDFRNVTGFPDSLASWASGDPCASNWTGVSCSGGAAIT